MADEVKPNSNQDQPQEAQLAAENMATGVEPTPEVDYDADYEAAKQMSVSEIDRTGEGAKAAEAATAPDFKVSTPQETKTVAEPTGNPDDYLNMAKDIGGSTSEGVSNVSDDLVKKALEKGQPGSGERD